LYPVLATDIDVSNFNSALKCIEEWANTWQLQLSVEKCCIFEINKKHSTSPTSSFCLNGVSLPTTNIVKDLGITVNDSLTPCTHIAKITATAHQRVNLIVRSFTSRDISILLRAYTTYVRPLLEYNTVFWSVSLKYDVTAVEKVQRRFTKR